MYDRERLQEFLEAVSSKYTAAELVEILEDNGIITVWDIINNLTDEIVDAKRFLEV